MVALSDFILTISRDEDYADLIIQCHGAKFAVHKIVVCKRCNTLKAAVDGFFKTTISPPFGTNGKFHIFSEAGSNNVIHINGFDADTVDRMIEYLYSGDYSLDSHEADSVDSPASAAIMPSSITTISNDIAVSALEEDMSDALKNPLLCHVRVNVVADCFNLPLLRNIANRKIAELLDKHWTVDWFAAFVQEVSDLCYTDKELRSITTTAAACHMKELAGREDWKRLNIPGDMHNEIYDILMRGHALKFAQDRKEKELMKELID
ncbi:hypothetical protein KEM54_002097 [Ascosphaera aggregata]|nr:hypothetical protein KEM54_002097 [Ascosphaera aggregata]